MSDSDFPRLARRVPLATAWNPNWRKRSVDYGSGVSTESPPTRAPRRRWLRSSRESRTSRPEQSFPAEGGRVQRGEVANREGLPPEPGSQILQPVFRQAWRVLEKFSRAWDRGAVARGAAWKNFRVPKLHAHRSEPAVDK